MTIDANETRDEDMPVIDTPRVGMSSSGPDIKSAKRHGKLSVTESETADEMDLDSFVTKGSQILLQGPVQPIGSQSSPWRKHVGVCEEGVQFPSVF